MADPSTYRPLPGQIPTQPGVYRFIDPHDRIIYVGKAKNLRARLSNYFQDLAGLHPRTQQMVTTACRVEWTVVASELEALALEYSWIKEFNPRFNVMFKDDKSYPYLAVTLNEEFPAVKITRAARRPGVKYFGPYTQVWAIRETLDLLLRVFPVRTCSAGVLRRAQRQGRPCLLGYIDRCAAPCVGKISTEEHRQMALELCAFMSGRTGKIRTEIKDKMMAASARMEYEDAARYRDQIQAIDTVLEKNAVVLGTDTNADVFGIYADDLEVAVQLFHVRAGRVRGVRGWVARHEDDFSEASLIENLLGQVYGQSASGREEAAKILGQAGGNAGKTSKISQAKKASKKEKAVSVDDVDHLSTQAIPPEILVPHLPENLPVITQWLEQIRGGKVTIRVPRRGDKKALADTVTENARAALRLHRSKQVSDLTQRGKALEDLAEYLDLPQVPLRIEGFDISHTSGTNQVGSMVVFEDGAPRKDAYRSFNIRFNEDGNNDDTAAMSQVLRRRFAHTEEDEPAEPAPASGPVAASSKPKLRFAYNPELLVVDGGPPQVAAAAATLAEIGVNIPVVGLAKRLEEIWVPGEDFPVILPRQSAALYLLQHLRDESHRFAIRHHRKKRAKSMVTSVLDQIPGLGPSRQKVLLKHFGSLKRIRAASEAELAQVKGFGSALARQIYESLHQDAEKASGKASEKGKEVNQLPDLNPEKEDATPS